MADRKSAFTVPAASLSRGGPCRAGGTVAVDRAPRPTLHPAFARAGARTVPTGQGCEKAIGGLPAHGR